MVFAGVEVRHWSQSSPVRRDSPVPIVVSFKPAGYRLCAVSNVKFLGRIMAGCRSGGISVRGAGQAQVIRVLLFGGLLRQIHPISMGACGIRMREFLWISRGESFGRGGGCRCV